MTRLTCGLLSLALAVGGTACKTSKGTEPDPVSVPSGPPARWTGTALFVEDVQAYPSITWNHRFEIEATWVKVENPNPAPPPGTTRYVPSGRVHAFMRSYSDAGRCEVNRDGEFPVSPPAVALFPDEQRLDVGPDGRYEGKLYGAFRLDYLQYCRSLDVTFQNVTTLHMRLELRGTVDGGRLHGDMQPKVLNMETLTSTSTGSWNFVSN